ncbi:GntR family transcriptional regulator [Tamilnaduibacter salinus]|uniref:GntR family transcriptional regulator n=1 Tax=Tamilnaduibacter salinus TaxID=1484056 RepID=A0A2A2I589_9GAMM|nr:GntR family transcriptional regulator [Tamilnaduibacter salinus]PAV26295.1 GntR family transcriptional regulator [Tamilnaduibacter salinus]PVY78040.1 GntR family transcriptional regulator [Tamilnaduibacter salinus]
MQFQAPESLSEQIAQHIGQQIVVGRLQPGERIQELRVAGELNVSRGSVREALLILQRRHLVEIYPRKGAAVSELTPQTVNSLYDIYINLLQMLVRGLIDVTEGSDLIPLIQKIRELDRLIEEDASATESIMEAGFGVMRMAYRLVDNPFLEETLENFRPAISRTYHIAIVNVSDGVSDTRRFFERLSAAAAERDQQALAAAISDFGERQRARVLDALAEETAHDDRSVSSARPDEASFVQSRP